MIIPVRCFTCGRVLGQDYETWKERVDAGEDAAKVMDELGISRYCCRRMIMANVDLVRESGAYE